MASMVDTSVKYFHSGMPGAPVLNGTPGSTLAVLDACLVTGWGLKSVDSLAVADNVATAGISAGHSFEVGTVVLVEGASPAGLNGEFRVTEITANTVKFATQGVGNQTATGTITMKIAPAGWEKPFGSTNIATYRSKDPAGTKLFLRVDDSGTTTCRAVGYESMVSADSGTAAFPTEAQRAGGLWWQKSSSADTTARPWFIAADGRLFYYGKAYHSSFATVFDVAVFGDIKSAKSADPFACVIFGRAEAAVTTPGAPQQLCYGWSSLAALYAARAGSGIGGSVQLSKDFPTLTRVNASDVYSGCSATGGPQYPNPTDGGLYLSSLNILEGNSGSNPPYRGVFPGYYCCPQRVVPGTFSHGDLVAADAGLPGRALRVVSSCYGTVPDNQTSFIDVTGPWWH